MTCAGPPGSSAFKDGASHLMSHTGKEVAPFLGREGLEGDTSARCHLLTQDHKGARARGLHRSQGPTQHGHFSTVKASSLTQPQHRGPFPFFFPPGMQPTGYLHKYVCNRHENIYFFLSY